MKLHVITDRTKPATPSRSDQSLATASGAVSNRDVARIGNSVNSRGMKVYVISNTYKTSPLARSASANTLKSGTKVPSFASEIASEYHRDSMFMSFRRLLTAILAVLFVCLLPVYAGDSPEIMPLSQIHPGMKGVAYTIFEGDQIEKMDLVVLGTLKNALGPKQDVILVQLIGEKVEHTG